jgi:hypothetical protein
VTFISIHTAGVQPADAAAFLEQQEWECLAAIDAGTMIEDSATANLYGVRGFPTLVVIDSRGTVSYNSGHEPADREAFLAQMQSDAEDLGFPWPLDKDADADVRQERTTQMLVHAMRREIDRVLPPSD